MIVDGFALEFRFLYDLGKSETCASVSSEGGRNEQALRLIDVSTRYEAVNSARYPPCCSYSYPGVYSPRLIVRTFRRIPVTGGREHRFTVPRLKPVSGSVARYVRNVRNVCRLNGKVGCNVKGVAISASISE